MIDQESVMTWMPISFPERQARVLVAVLDEAAFPDANAFTPLMASHGRINYNFTEEELAVLEQHKQEWQDADRPQRRVIATKVYSSMKKKNPDWDVATKKLRKEVSTMTLIIVITAADRCIQGVHWWFHTFGRKRGSRERFDGVKRWNGRLVAAIEREQELREAIQEASNGSKPGSQEYFACYQRELSKICNNMSEAQQAKYRAIADRWNKIGPPEEEQQKQVFS